MIRFNFKGTLQRLAQVRAFLGDINTPGGLGDATASDILAARAGGAVMLPVMTGLPLGKRCSRPAGVQVGRLSAERLRPPSALIEQNGWIESAQRRTGAPTLSSFCRIRSASRIEHRLQLSRRKLVCPRPSATGSSWPTALWVSQGASEHASCALI